MAPTMEDEWLWGWDPTPGIVSVWAEADGRAYVWRRLAGVLSREDVRFRPRKPLDNERSLAEGKRHGPVRRDTHAKPDRSIRFDFIRGLASIAGMSAAVSRQTVFARRNRAIQRWRARRFSRIK